MVMDAISPQTVGREFVRQYYTLLNQAPLHLHRFYSQESSFVHGGPIDNEKECQPVHGQQEIHQRIMQLNFRDCKAKIRHVDAHSTLGNGVVVQVSGELSNNGQPLRRFMQTFVLAPQSPKKYYVHNDIFRYQDEVFPDDEMEEEMNDVAVENEKNLANETAPSAPIPTPMMKPVPMPTASVGVDGITTVSINATAAPVNPHHEIKKDVPHLNGGQGHGPPTSAIDSSPHQLRTSAVAPDLTTSNVPVSGAPGMTLPSGRPQPDVTGGNPAVGQQQQVTQPMAQRAPVTSQPQPPVAVASPVRPVNHVAPEVESESSEENSGSAGNEKEEEAPEFEDGPQEKPQQQPEPAPAEPRNQGPPTYANLVKSGPTLVPSQGSLPPAGFTKPSATSPAPLPQTGLGQSGNGGRGDKDAGFAGQGQQGPGKFRPGGRPSIGGGGSSGRGGGPAPPGGSGRERDRFSFGGKDGEGLGQDGQDRRRTMGGGIGGSGQYPDSHQLFVGNLPHNCTEKDLEELFGKFGKVAEVRISAKGVAQSKTTASGQRVPNFGFVVFEEEKSVNECLREKPIHLNDGHRLNVETKKNKPMMRSDGQAMGSLSAGGGSSQTRGSQEHLGSAGRSDRPRGGSRGGPRGGGGRSETGGRGGGSFSGSGSGGPGSQRGGSESRGGGSSQGGPSRGGGTFNSNRRS